MAESDRIKWDQRFAQAGEIDLAPPDWLKEVDAALPVAGDYSAPRPAVLNQSHQIAQTAGPI